MVTRLAIRFQCGKVHYAQDSEEIEFPYYINGQRLSKVSEQKDLGVLVSKDLKPTKYISSIMKKVNQRLGMIKRCFPSISPDVIINLYITLILSILEYCSPVWNPWTQKGISALVKVQKRCEKLCNSELKCQPLTERRNQIDLKEAYKIINNAYLMDKYKLFQMSDMNSRGNSNKMYVHHNRMDIRKKVILK